MLPVCINRKPGISACARSGNCYRIAHTVLLGADDVLIVGPEAFGMFAKSGVPTTELLHRPLRVIVRVEGHGKLILQGADGCNGCARIAGKRTDGP